MISQTLFEESLKISMAICSCKKEKEDNESGRFESKKRGD